MVTNEDVKKKVMATVIEQLGANNINSEVLANWANWASVYGSALGSEAMASNLSKGTEEREDKCVVGYGIVLDPDGYYYFSKHAAIINWDNAKNTNFVINY